MAGKSAVIFVHGIFSSPRTWDPLVKLLTADSEVSSAYDMLAFEYQTPRWNWRLTRRIPDFNAVADSLSTFIEVECATRQRLVLVSHSQGGLIVQRCLARMVESGRGMELGKIRRVVLLACPNNGSELLLLIRKSAKFWVHPQERELRPISDSVIETQRRVLSNVVFADQIASDRCPIPFAVYAGESDNVVTPGSAISVFPLARVIPGDHNSILRADSNEHRTFTTIKANLLFALSERFPDPRAGLVPGNPSTRQEQYLSPDKRTPLMRVTTTTTQGAVSRSQGIEIYDAETRDLWIQAQMTSPTAQLGHDDAD